jgi:NADPH-dependent 2,4-dienoyl-CoA reductase/sulfur reductase-like enzyme
VSGDVTRRRFVTGTVAGGAAVALPVTAEARPANKQGSGPTRKVEVAIVGAGFAGLTAARALTRAGRSVAVTWTAPSARASGRRRKCSPNCRVQAATEED